MMKKEPLDRPTRRDFLLKAGVALAAGPWIVPSSALGLDGHVAPSERIVIGSIGVGGQGSGLTRHAMSHADVQVVAVCDVDTPASQSMKSSIDERYGNQDCKIYSDFRELLARSDIDAVIVGTPDHWHAIPVIQAAKAGKDIYCEKPLSHDLREGRAMCDAVQRYGVIFQTGSMQRSSGNMKKACEIVRNGYLGRIHHVNVILPDGGHEAYVKGFPPVPDSLDYEFWVGPAPWAPYHPQRMKFTWRWWMDFGGGQLMDWIGHHGDIAHMGLGLDEKGPMEIHPVLWDLPARSNIYNAPSDYRFECVYETGMTMTVANKRKIGESYEDHGDTGTQWFGEDGQWVFVSRSKLLAQPADLLNVLFAGNDFRFRTQHDHMRDFLDCVKSRREPIAPVEAAHRSASIGHLGKIACILGRTLKWDVEKEEVIGDEMANRMLGKPYRGDWRLA